MPGCGRTKNCNSPLHRCETSVPTDPFLTANGCRVGVKSTLVIIAPDLGHRCSRLGLQSRVYPTSLDRKRGTGGWGFWKGYVLLCCCRVAQKKGERAHAQKKSVKRKVCSSSSRLDSLGLSFLMGSCFKKSSADENQCLLWITVSELFMSCGRYERKILVVEWKVFCK